MICQPVQWMSTGRDGGDQAVHDLTLAYDPTNPYAVELRFILDSQDPEAVLVWEVDRGLLAAGTGSWAGDGDVHVSIWAAHPHLVLVRLLDGETGRWGNFLARRSELEDFVARTFAAVPAGAEHVDIDTALVRILAGGEGP